MPYKYKEGKIRIKEILNDYIEVETVDHIPNDNSFTFKNAYYGWVTAIFVDIRNSTKLFTEHPKQDVSRIIRSFTSEVIEILKEDDYLLEIGIRGDCVYAVYSAPTKPDEDRAFDKTCYVNTLIKMLNYLLEEKKLPNIAVGIGMATAEELVVKAGRAGSGINNKVWIGKAVTMAANLSSLGNKNSYDPIILTSESYNALNTQNKEFCNKTYSSEYGDIYEANVVMSDFNKWILGGMIN